ncbi:MAG TPA: hypothetical protein VK842_02590, partial [bacterium]|nr:hypothetical protein [bacterium]
MLAAAGLSASQTNSGLGGQSGTFLTLPPDARSAAMGQAGAALAVGAESMGLNPAGLASQTGQDLEISQNMLPQGASQQSMEYGMGLGSRGAFGLSAGFINMGS